MEPVLARGMEKGPRLFLRGHPDRARVCIRVGRRGRQLLPDASLVLPPCEAIPKARAAAIRALELDETLAEAHASLGVIKAYDWDGPSAEKRTSHPLVKIFMRHHTSNRSRGAPLGIPV
jgi:hypothetical protein